MVSEKICSMNLGWKWYHELKIGECVVNSSRDKCPQWGITNTCIFKLMVSKIKEYKLIKARSGNGIEHKLHIDFIKCSSFFSSKWTKRAWLTHQQINPRHEHHLSFQMNALIFTPCILFFLTYLERLHRSGF